MERQGRDQIRAEITGGVSGQVAVGSSIRQVQSVGARGAVTEAELAHVGALFAQLRSQVAHLTPADQRDGAVERVDELHQALVAEAANPTTMRYVKRWFARRLPQLAGLVTSVFADPIVGRLLQAAGDGLVEEFVGSEQP